MRRLVSRLALVAALGVSAALMPTSADADSASAAAAFIQSLGDRTIAVMREAKGLGDAEREARFRNILVEGFDIPTIGRFVLGRYWRRATKAQREEYFPLFIDFIVRVYAAGFKTYHGETFHVVTMRHLKRGDTLVRAIINQPDKPPVKVDFRVRKRHGRFKVIDVIVEGISMLVTQRDEFSSVISRKGLEGFLADLKAQVKGKEKQPATG